MTERRKRLALLAAILGSFVAGLDATAVNVALPAIERDLGGGLAGQQWVSNAYLLTLGSLILVGGSLGDIYGERRIFTLGVIGFGVVSVICALAPSIEVLVAGRALQGVFGALLTPSALAVIVATFPPDERGAAIGSWTAWGGIAMVIGPLAGGWLIDVATWRWIFAINVPFVIATVIIVRMAVSERTREGPQVHLDYLGAVLCALGLAGPGLRPHPPAERGLGLPRGAHPGHRRPRDARPLHRPRGPDAAPDAPAGPLPAAQLRRRQPRDAPDVRRAERRDLLPRPLPAAGGRLRRAPGRLGDAADHRRHVLPVAPRRALADRFGPRWFMGGGPLVAAAGLAMLQRVDAHVDYVSELLPALLIFALGLSATVAPLTATVLADADESNAGIASGVNNAIARVAGLLAVAALGAVVAGQFGATIDQRLVGQSLSPEAERIVNEAKQRTLTRADPDGLPAAEASVVSQAAEDAAVNAFHRGAGIAAALVALGGAARRSSGSATRAARCPARAAPAASSRAPRSRPRARAGRCPRRPNTTPT